MTDADRPYEYTEAIILKRTYRLMNDSCYTQVTSSSVGGVRIFKVQIHVKILVKHEEVLLAIECLFPGSLRMMLSQAVLN